MEENFDTYGQVSPLSYKYNFDNPEEKRLDNFAMGQTLGYFDEQRAVLEKKRDEIHGLGKVIDANYQQWKNSSFLSPEAKERARGTYMNNVVALEQHHAIPRDQRGVEWFAQFENLKNNINSEDINNDLKNRALYEDVYKQKVAGNITETEFNRWYDDFKVNAADGKDYEKTSILFKGGRPANAHESLFQSARTMIDTAQFASSDYNYDVIGNIIGVKDSAWQNFMDKQLIPAAFQDGYTRFKNLPEEMKTKYTTNGDDVEGTKAYMKELFNNYRYAHNTHYIDPNSKRAGSEVDVFRNYYSDAINKSQVVESEDDIPNKAIPFYAPNSRFLRPSKAKVVFDGLEMPIMVATGKYEADGKTPQKVKKIIRFKKFNASENDNYEFDDPKGVEAGDMTKMSTYQFGNPNGGKDQMFRMHDQTIQMNEASLRTLIQRNLILNQKNIVLVNELGQTEDLTPDMIGPINQQFEGNSTALDYFLDSGGGSFLDTSIDGNVSIIPGKRVYKLRKGIVDGISLAGINPQSLNMMYAQTKGVDNIGGSVSDRTGSTMINASAYNFQTENR